MGNISDFNEHHLKSLYDEYGEELYLFAAHVLNNVMEADDVIQEFFIKYWQKKVSGVEISSFKSYAYKSVYNACISILRSKNKNPATENLDNVQDIINKNNALNEEQINALQEQLYAAIETLPERCRLILKMVYFENKTYAEVAEMLSLSTNTIKVQMSKAYRILREYYKNIDIIIILIIVAVCEQKFM